VDMENRRGRSLKDRRDDDLAIILRTKTRQKTLPFFMRDKDE